jgi:prepilin-type processing-associated H-X9-DG protein
MNTCPACAEPISGNGETCPKCGISLHEGAGSGGGSGRRLSTLTVVFIVVGCVCGVLVMCGGIVAVLVVQQMRGVPMAREAARRSQCKNNLKQIGLALHNYHDVYGSFPPASVADASGKPMHSWRVLILPFLDQQSLYGEYDFSEPWDGPNNRRLLDRMPLVYACPSHANPPGNTNTAYVVPVGEHCIFRGSEPVRVSDIIDGTSNTLMVGEGANITVPWMKPDDVDIATHPAIGDSAGFSSDHPGGVHFLLGDGSVRFISETIAPDVLRALFTRDGGEALGAF